MEALLLPGEYIVQEFGTVTFDMGGKKDKGPLYVTNGRLLIYDKSSNSFPVDYDPTLLKDTKAQQKVSKDNPTTDASNSVSRLVNTTNNKPLILITFHGKECNNDQSNFNKAYLTLKESKPIPKVSKDQVDNTPLELRIFNELCVNNKTLASILNTKDDLSNQFFTDNFNNFESEIISIFAKHRSQIIGYSSKDQWQLSQKADTTSGANISKYSLDEQTIRQIFRRHPKFHEEYKKLSTPEEQEKFFSEKFIDHIRKYNDITQLTNIEDIDIEHFNPQDTQYRFKQLEICCNIEKLGDTYTYSGIFDKDTMKPPETITLTDVSTHTELVLIELGVIPDTSKNKTDINKYKNMPIERIDSLAADLSVPEEIKYTPFCVDKSKLFQQSYTAPSQEEWTSSIDAFNSELHQAHQSFTDAKCNFNQFRTVLIEMTIKSQLLNDYDISALTEEQISLIEKFAEFYSELEIYAFTYWKAIDKKAAQIQTQIREKVQNLKDRVQRFVRTSDEKMLLNSLFDNMNSIIDPILGGKTFAQLPQNTNATGFSFMSF
ncbi:hypothetical protein TVAG_277140 [Trichomonas vaginalis G3]|uniref:Uncharacterized protein n=1 Tax=Trichomonas vaginalis (strain ATCC PRA-98 / G3) TaxID=412133 RepID=A2FP74_TRIV3|nr:hypothetical protein TVAGG3_0154540 [Trichomonas vaginalis G3]EAX93309.1 hypothetical protein TVAG_277140 [Trichomonas vaginalis G3]KAI5547479.1 hypothetical protein TVAGG3_0154540 [Trichomonas vaginalis G3]|eukprot:XP_001306239.1 hypothetical protein [Trichomonas vaginalis G3]